MLLAVAPALLFSQQYELNSGWKCGRANTVKKSGEEISQINFPLTNWMPAVVPGTVLTSLLANKLIPDPFFGMNNKQIPDIYNTGRDYYTYWFVKDFTEVVPAKDDKVWLQLRGINYSCNVFLNGHKVNDVPDKGMYLRENYDITPFLSKDGNNRLAVIVYPPDPVGNPNGGQGGDGAIAHSITNQYVAGWDWIQPVHDRNTGIWDKVFIEKTKQVNIDNTHVVTLVPGRRTPDGIQKPAAIKVTTEAENTDSVDIEGVLQYEVEGKKATVKVKLEAHTMQLVEFPTLYIDSPRLWWPNGYGAQNLYDLKVKFLINGKTLSDEEQVTFGIKELKAVWNNKTKSRELRVNGQKIFIKGGNWIVSDEMLRCSKERYDAEVHFHHDMNLNVIRVWGGGITERPEFYDACDKYGLLVMQDFWVSGDCNGRWDDPMKLDDSDTRKKYPDDHGLFVESLEDQIKMLRNHPSLAYWCGGNEIRPPADVLSELRDSLLPSLDGTRFFFEYSNDDSMSLNSGDGPYTIQNPDSFFTHRSFPFNSEVGSVGIGDMESLERFIPKEDLVPPAYDSKAHQWKVDSVWQYHKYIGYDSAVQKLGGVLDIRDFGLKAQIVNYNQYRALMEGFSEHMWDWYTGVIVWKTQNPWTAMVGQMYDAYLDPNACLYGLSEGAKPLHIMYDPVKKTVMIVNNNFNTNRVKASIKVYNDNYAGKVISDTLFEAPANKASMYKVLTRSDNLIVTPGSFLSLSISDTLDNILDQNIYWLPDSKGNYVWPYSTMDPPNIPISASKAGEGRILVKISNPNGNPVLYFNRISLADKKTRKRILPVFYNNNYISVLPGQTGTVEIIYTPENGVEPIVYVEGWNIRKYLVYVK